MKQNLEFLNDVLVSIIFLSLQYKNSLRSNMHVHYIEILDQILNGMKFFPHNLLDIGNSSCLTVGRKNILYFFSTCNFWYKSTEAESTRTLTQVKHFHMISKHIPNHGHSKKLNFLVNG
jgi:hypothetical protein